MSLESCIYFIGIYYFLLAIPILIASFFNKNKIDTTCTIIISILNSILMFFDVFMLWGILGIQISLLILFFYIGTVLACSIYVLTIILSFVFYFTKIKNRKNKEKIETKENNENNETNIKTKKYKAKSIISIILVIVITLIPIGLVLKPFIKQLILINKSDLIIVFYSNGNGGIGDTNYFGYAINEDFCEEIELGIDTSGYYLGNFIFNDYTKNEYDKNDPNSSYKYEYDYKDEYIKIYKNGKLIHNKKIPSAYFNNKIENSFYIKH